MTEVRYRALRVGWTRAALGCIVGPTSLGMLGLGAVLLTLESLAGVLGALMCLVIAILVVVIVLIGTRLQFTVDDEGVTLVHYLRTRRILWAEVAVIEQETSYWWMPGAVVVVLKEPLGMRITALATTDRMALYRGENLFAFGAPAEQLRAPTRAAIDAHRRWIAALHR